MSSDRTRSYLTRIGSRSEAEVKDNDPDKSAASPSSGSGDRPRYSGYRTASDDSGHGSLRKSALSAPVIGHRENQSLASIKRNGHAGGHGSVSMSTGIGSTTTTNSSTTSSSTSSSTRSAYSSSTYIPIGKRLQNPYLAENNNSHSPANSLDSGDDKISTASRREVRDAFLRGETPKYDPSLRENVSSKTDREKDKERQVHLPHHGSTDRPPKAGPKEIVAEGYVGFVNLPNQVYRKAVKRGFEFTLMVVGESGLGKSTLINSMFLTDLYNNEYPGPTHRTKKTIQVETTQVVLKEGGVQLKLTVVDTPGFGDAVDNSNCWQPIIDHIEARYEDYLNSESRVHRTIEPDLRVHCCLYFISPNGHGLKPLDVEFMRRLHDKVNIIPLIAKADTMTPQECRDFKKTVLNEIAQHKIKIYEFPDPEDDDEAKLQKKLKDRVPFAVIGSNTVVDSGGRKVRGRVYPWGTVEVENLEHNDFIALRNMLIRTHMQDLKDVTNNVHYENYRYNKLVSVTKDDKSRSTSKSPLLQLEEERKEHDAKMKKMEAEMEQVFEMKVKEKRNKIKESEADLEKRAEQMRKTQEQQEKELKERIAAFEKEQKLWEEQHRVLQEQMRTLDKEKTKRKGIF